MTEENANPPPPKKNPETKKHPSTNKQKRKEEAAANQLKAEAAMCTGTMGAHAWRESRNRDYRCRENKPAEAH